MPCWIFGELLAHLNKIQFNMLNRLHSTGPSFFRYHDDNYRQRGGYESEFLMRYMRGRSWTQTLGGGGHLPF